MLSVGVDPAGVEQRLISGGLVCPDCGSRLAPWGHAAERFVRQSAESVRRIRPRRAICSRAGGCGRTHVLLPRFWLARRVDPVAVIWAALLARAAGWGWRRICAAAGRPASTVRGWLARFSAHAEEIRVGFARLERLAGVGADMDRLAPAGSPVADAVAQIGAGCAAVRRAAGSAVVEVSAAEVVAACSGGWAFGCAATGDRGGADQHLTASVTEWPSASGSTASLSSITKALRWATDVEVAAEEVANRPGARCCAVPVFAD